MNLSQLPKGGQATVLIVNDDCAQDAIAHRLRELGFVVGASVKILAKGFLGGNPLVVRVGNTRFALRKKEAQRIQIVTSL